MKMHHKEYLILLILLFVLSTFLILDFYFIFVAFFYREIYLEVKDFFDNFLILSAIISAVFMPFVMKQFENYKKEREKHEIYQKCLDSLNEICKFGLKYPKSSIPSEVQNEPLPSILLLSEYKKELLDIDIVYYGWEKIRNEDLFFDEKQGMGSGDYEIYIRIKPNITIKILFTTYFGLHSISIERTDEKAREFLTEKTSNIVFEALQTIADRHSLKYKIP